MTLIRKLNQDSKQPTDRLLESWWFLVRFCSWRFRRLRAARHRHRDEWVPHPTSQQSSAVRAQAYSGSCLCDRNSPHLERVRLRRADG